MRMRSTIMAGLCLLWLGAPAWSAKRRVHVIDIDKLAFGPAPEGLRVNDIVEWTNVDIFQHTATARDGSFDLDLPPGATGRTILRRAGAIAYYCRHHPGMQGQLDVAP